ncbi:MAG: hypothetical protein ACYDBQ_02440 [Thermoplasmatota archaeon]
MDLAVDRKLMRRGSGYGLRLTAKKIAALGLRPGDKVHALISPARITNHFSRLAVFDFPPWPRGKTLNAGLEDETGEKQGRAGRRR